MSLSNLGSAIQRMFFMVDKYGWEGYKLWRNKNVKEKKLAKHSLKGIKYDLYLRTTTTDYPTFKQLFVDGEYDHPLKEEPKVIVDCGANIGLASVYYANKYPSARIIAIEPETNNFNLLKKNTERYGNVTCLQNGIWSRSTNLAFENSTAESWAFVTKEVDYSNEHTISAISIADIMKRFDIDTIDILKMDIEGSEKEVFEAQSMPWLDKCKVIIIETHDSTRKGTAHAFFNAINDRDYSLFINGENFICELV